MEVRLSPELKTRLDQWTAATGRPADDLIEEAMAGNFDELGEVRAMLDRRYDELKSGRVSAIDGETFFESLRHREEELLKQRPPQ
jgi:predicted DNA-binding protein